MLDVDEVQLDFIEIGALGENSVQTLEPAMPNSGVTQFVVDLTGSAAFARHSTDWPGPRRRPVLFWNGSGAHRGPSRPWRAKREIPIDSPRRRATLVA